MTPTVSIVVPSLHAPTVDATLRSLRAQTAAASIREVLVVGLDRHGLVREDGLVRLVSTGRPASAAAARNLGIRQSGADWIAFIDSDCVAAPDWLERLLGQAAAGGMVIGGSVTIDSPNYWTFADNLAMFHSLVPSRPAGRRMALPTLNLLVARDVIAAVGLMDEGFAGAAGEDFDWTLRMHEAGYALHFAPAANVHHRPARGTVGSLLRHSWRSGYNMSIVRQRHRRHYPAAGLLAHPRALQSLAPLIGLASGLRICAAGHPRGRSLAALPAVWLAKLGWCLGAALRAHHQAAGGRQRKEAL